MSLTYWFSKWGFQTSRVSITCDLSEKQILRPHPRSSESESLGMSCSHLPSPSLMTRILYLSYFSIRDFPGGAGGKELANQCRKHKKCGFDPWVRKIPWRRKWQHIPEFLPGESHEQRSLVGCSPCGHRELVMTETT